MTVYEFCKEHLEETCWDIWDNVIDDCVNVELPEEITDDYDRFVTELCKHVDMVDSNNMDDFEIVADWYGMIEKNETIFREFSDKNWYKNNHADFDDFACEWIKELHLWMAGYLPEDMYADAYELAKKLK